MALEAGEDIVDHHPGKLPSFGLQAHDEGGLQALQVLSGGVQRRKDGAE
jgi:hypothetical protein